MDSPYESSHSTAPGLARPADRQLEGDSNRGRQRPGNALKPAILLFGPTGTGKTSLIKSLTGEDTALVGHDLHPCTTRTVGYLYTDNETGLKAMLIDTPGFDDLQKLHLDILSEIVDYIRGLREYRVVSIVLFYRITDAKVFGSSLIYLKLLRAFCGEAFTRNLVLVTTMWNRVPQHLLEEAEAREAELNSTSIFWGDLFEKGSKSAAYLRWNDSLESSRKIVNTCVAHDAPELKILQEMRQGVPFEETSASRVLTEEIRKAEEKKRRRIEEQERELQELEHERRRMERDMWWAQGAPRAPPRSDRSYHHRSDEGEGSRRERGHSRGGPWIGDNDIDVVYVSRDPRCDSRHPCPTCTCSSDRSRSRERTRYREDEREQDNGSKSNRVVRIIRYVVGS